MRKNVKFLTTAALIAAMYAVVTLALAPISFGQVQFRVSEMLTVLPFLTPAAVPGLFIGCIIGNLSSPLGPVDILVGSLATLLAAFLSRKMPKKILVPLPPIIVNAVVVGTELFYLVQAPLIATILYVGMGEFVVCYLLGYPLLLALDRYKGKIF